MYNEIYQAYIVCISDLLERPEVQSMNLIQQHASGVSCLDHCMFVAYVTFVLCHRWRLNIVPATRAALLHDMYLCDWNTTKINKVARLFVHPKMAVENAKACGLCSDLEQDIILNHMWPVTPLHIPRCRESFIVNLADKLCATAEMLHLYPMLSTSKQLESITRACLDFQVALPPV